VLIPGLAARTLALACGFHGRGRWVGLWWEADNGDVIWTNGGILATGYWPAWWRFCDHPRIRRLLRPRDTLGSGLRAASHALVLDIERNAFTLAPMDAARDFLASNVPEPGPFERVAAVLLRQLLDNTPLTPGNSDARAIAECAFAALTSVKKSPPHLVALRELCQYLDGLPHEH
jgi:hypothetical protein